MVGEATRSTATSTASTAARVVSMVTRARAQEERPNTWQLAPYNKRFRDKL